MQETGISKLETGKSKPFFTTEVAEGTDEVPGAKQQGGGTTPKSDILCKGKTIGVTPNPPSGGEGSRFLRRRKNGTPCPPC